MNKEFWKGKSVFLTGHTGFKGSWLSLWLQNLGANVIGFSKSIPTKPSLYELANVENGMNSITGNVCDYSHLESVITKYKPEIVIHMAAQSILRESYRDPIETYSTNVMGTVNLLEAIHKIGSTRIILNITSDKCYEITNLSKGYAEDDPMGGYDPYSNSKGCAELVTSSFRNSFFNISNFENHKVALASARAGNVVGGGDWGTDRLIPDIIKGIISNDKIRIRFPNAVRPWQYVLDALHGYLILIEKLWESGPEFIGGWNFGPTKDETQPVKWILEKFSSHWNHKINWIIDDNDNPHEEEYLELDCSKAKSRLGWNSKMTLENTLTWTIDWYKKYIENHDMRTFSEKQIQNFNSK